MFVNDIVGEQMKEYVEEHFREAEHPFTKSRSRVLSAL